MLETVYIARHGFRSNWIKGYDPKTPTGIDSDHTLAPHGLDQAQELAKHIVSLDKKPEAIFSSPLYRCIQTATPMSHALGLKIRVENGISELYRPDREVIPQPASLELLRKHFPELDASWKSLVTPSKNGETEVDILDRCKRFWALFVPIFEKQFPDITTVIFVSHAATKVALGMAMMGFNSVRDDIKFGSDRYLKAGACSLDTYSRNGDKWELQVNGDTSFLSKGEEMNWHFMEAGSDEDIRRREEKKLRKEKKAQAQVADDDIEEVYVAIEVASSDLNKMDSSDQFSSQNPASTQLLANQSATRASFRSSNSKHFIEHSSFTSSSYKPTSKIQYSGLESNSPLVKIDDQVFQGQWKQLLGTELIFNEQGEVIGTVRDHIQLTKGELVAKDEYQEQKEKLKSGKINLFEEALRLAGEMEAEEVEAEGEQEPETNAENNDNDNDIQIVS